MSAVTKPLHVKKVFFFFLLCSSLNLKAQLQVGVNGGLVFPNLEESGMFKSSMGINTSICYNTPINLMFGAHLSFINNMKLSNEWIYAKLGNGNIESNTAYLKHNPMFALSVQYLINFNYDLTSLYFGINVGKCASSAHGAVVVTSGVYQNRLGFYEEVHKNYVFSPKFGIAHEIVKNLKLNAELKIDIFKVVDKEEIAGKDQLINLNLGLIYVFKPIK